METGIHNTSEIGRLRKVLLHRPGQELENLMPEYLERLLFDDIPYLKEAQAEHDAFAQCLRDAGVEVVYLIDLVVNSLTSPEVRQELVTQFLKEADLPDEAVGKAVAEYLSELDDRAMVSAMMAGIRRQLALRPEQALLQLEEICYSRLCKSVLCCQTYYTDFFDFAMVRKLL